VASNRLSEIRLERRWRAGSQAQNTVTMAGRTWYTKERFSTTPDKDLARVDISVFSDKNTQKQSASLFGYITRYKKPSANQNSPQPPNPPDSAGDDEGQGQ
jgi:hypothetical protein